MLIESSFQSDREQRETFPVEMAGFPCQCRRNELDWYPDKTIPWHWHNVFEINYIKAGAPVCQTPDRTVTAHKGEVLFINSGVLHTCTSSEPDCTYLCTSSLHCAELQRTGKGELDISEECGFRSASYFGKVFREAMGLTPKDDRNQKR